MKSIELRPIYSQRINPNVGSNAAGQMSYTMTKDLSKCLEIICNFPTIYKTGDKRPVDILNQSGYLGISQHLTEEEIAKHINNNLGLVEIWLNYSEDIRHSPAWDFTRWTNQHGLGTEVTYR